MTPAGCNVNNRKTSLNLGTGMGIGINSWKREGVGLKFEKDIPAHLYFGLNV